MKNLALTIAAVAIGGFAGSALADEDGSPNLNATAGDRGGQTGNADPEGRKAGCFVPGTFIRMFAQVAPPPTDDFEGAPGLISTTDCTPAEPPPGEPS